MREEGLAGLRQHQGREDVDGVLGVEGFFWNLSDDIIAPNTSIINKNVNDELARLRVSEMRFRGYDDVGGRLFGDTEICFDRVAANVVFLGQFLADTVGYLAR